MEGHFEYFDERGARVYEWLVRLRLFEWAYSATIKELARLVPPGARVLEIGPGVGRMLQRMERFGYRLYGADISTAMLRRAVRRTSAGLVAGASWALPFKRRSFDAGVALFTLHHWGPHDESVRAAASVLREGGVFLAVEVDGDRIYAGGHSCTARCLTEALSPYFNVAIKRRFPLIFAVGKLL
ncbi:class I SAM-dependent methyltransferase [Thermoproteus tenax]|uniref:SAM-dependent methyltransferase n=1 Tax=Thermoproteus tenax (strain ATCC 35583 / DSM 2078 / JCM 9277 / NBRC 100435 / Kra 1) TaxID=768679 RepID=G4RJH2_THETK|nr:class I SAM-dependent methyltransferase [Thermoproteus tenax]CCC81717.1 SAM-dependent methyltransferase [Thermoproteus tenax Kra 1]